MPMLNKNELRDLFFIQHQLTDDLLTDSGLRTFASVLNENLDTDVYIDDRFRDDIIYADQKIKKKQRIYALYKRKKINT
ncbi:hypothetical protein SAMN04515655_12417 [Halanaerobium congolense]|jgi:hypothetical protein|uniref:Uncharacterized protein n=2 Tax=Halanaerobium congolense TaxID=54121 RepID=A0A4R7E7N3_9FIRM|nr:hypothetical protein BY453_11440 [Halanaerobium congolense]SDK88262.1 hypothetical protein SAMN04515655_12417 [Halanaerobium congolense]SDM70546.1 hypothetical protein SAMN04488599_12216 [Halanaerobium congolense]